MASGCDKVWGSKMIEPSSRIHVSGGAPRLVTIGGRSTIADDCAGALAGESAGLSAAGGGAGRNASNTAPTDAARQIAIANSINDPLLEDCFTMAPCGAADSDISAPARMAWRRRKSVAPKTAAESRSDAHGRRKR